MLRSVLFTALLALSASATAQDFDYNYLSLGYQRVNLDDGTFDVDGDGLGLEGSFEVGESFFIFGGYGMAEFEEQGITVDVDQATVGLGWHTELSDNVDFVTGLSYEYIDVSALGLGVDDNGIGLGVGLRYAASDNIEINGGVDYVDYSDGGDDTTFGLGFLYGVTESIDIGLNGEWGDDSSAYGISGRFYFGN
jgi:hypothetical protein